MQPSRAPWWFYIVSASFVGFFALQVYTYMWGIEYWGFGGDYSTDSMVVHQVAPNGAGARAGLRAGDRIVAVDGSPLPPKRPRSGWFVAYSNFEVERPIRLKIEREGQEIELTLTLRRGSPRDMGWREWQNIGNQAFTLILALLIALRRPHDRVVLIGGWFLASSVFSMIPLASGWAAVWRHLPDPLGLLLWPASVTRGLISGLSLAFIGVFPRRLFNARWVWILLWTPVVLVAALQSLLYIQLVYRPRSVTELVMLNSEILWMGLSLFLYMPAFLVGCIVQYRRLEDVNERRRMRLLFTGMLISGLCVMTLVALSLFARVPAAINLTPVPALVRALYLAGPVAFAYAVLHHRVFDLGVIVRRGLQYALARGALVSAVPILAAIFIADLLLHGNQPILAVFRARGWIYVALAALAAVALMKRRDWLEALDRRFFREQYDARRLLCEVVEEVRTARSFEQEAPQVTSRIESALHPEFVVLLVSGPRDKFYRTLAASPAGTGPPPVLKESKFVALVRLLGKPVEVSQTSTSWVQQQLPHEETEYLRRGRIDLLVPVATNPEGTEVLLVLGVKRSEEPYSSEDQDLLVAIAANLAILLERPATTAPVSRTDIFEECPQCGSCYDSGSSRCGHEGARLIPVILPRLLEGRYHLDRRLGRGGMGTVYAASDTLLERRVAVKVIREELVGSVEAAERFRREAKAAASFSHPNVVTVHDFGVASGTRAFLVMEMLEGLTLREKLRSQKRLEPVQLMTILRDVCAALSSAHRRQLIHRDLKPENIFLVTGELGGFAKVLDFGLAKFVSNTSEQKTQDTASGAVLGTLRYMSPEQRCGQAVNLGWDLWALAVIAYEMLTGCYPFEESPYGLPMAADIARFTPVAHCVAARAEKWQALFERSFARELDHRHESVEAFWNDVERAAT